MSKVRYEQRAEAGEETLQDTLHTDKWEYGAPIPAPKGLELCEAVSGKHEDGLMRRYIHDTHYNLMIIPKFEHSSRLQGRSSDETKKRVHQLAQAILRILLRFRLTRWRKCAIFFLLFFLLLANSAGS